MYLVAELQGGAGHLGRAQLHEGVAPLAVQADADDRLHARRALGRVGCPHRAVEQLAQRIFCHEARHEVAHIDLQTRTRRSAVFIQGCIRPSQSGGLDTGSGQHTTLESPLKSKLDITATVQSVGKAVFEYPLHPRVGLL